jgi:hypothetical protein
MRGERGQASIEWIGAVLMVALALAGLARLAERVEAADLATSPLRITICAVRGGCAEQRPAGASQGRPHHAVIAPPLVPLAADPRSRRTRNAPRRPSRTRALARRARGPLRTFSRRAWLVCFGYERVRYGLLHPESGPRQTVPISGVLQMVNDCASPVDFARDWELLR